MKHMQIRSAMRLTAMALSVVLLLGGCGAPAPASQEEAPSLPEPLVSQEEAPEPPVEAVPPFLYGRSFLEGEELAFYDELAAALKQEGTGGSIPLPPGLGEDAALAVAELVRGDDPTTYWARFALETGQEAETRRLSWDSLYTPEETAERRRELEARRDAILLPLESASPFEKALAIHDAVAVIPYDRQEGPDSGNAYGALVGEKAFCNGYAAGFHYLALEAGLDSVYIKGFSNRGVRHAWNAIRLDGAWHYVDPTWDRPLSYLDDVYHDYFLVDWEEIKSDHIWEGSQYPALPESGGDGFSGYYARMGYAVAGIPPEDGARELADLLYRQLTARESYPAQSAPLFLEFKVEGGAENYQAWKSLCVRELFSIVEELGGRALEEGKPFRISDGASAKLNFNDLMQVITFYPYVQAVG